MTFKQVLLEHDFKFCYRHANGKSQIYYRKSDRKYVSLVPSYLYNQDIAHFQKVKYYSPEDFKRVLDAITVRKIMHD